MTQEQIYELLHSTETSRVERTVSTGDMDKFQETAEIQEIEKAIKEDSDKMSKLMSKLIPSHFQVEEQKKVGVAYQESRPTQESFRIGSNPILF